MNNKIKPAYILKKYYQDNEEALTVLINHSRMVAHRSVGIARNLTKCGTQVDIQFVAEAAMLHDLGIFETDAPELNCFGSHSYLMHGIKGAEILIAEGYPRHARVCERHIGIGLTAMEILSEKLPLPARNMLPETIEEQIICYADLFYSKGLKNRDKIKSYKKVRKTLDKYGVGKSQVFEHWRKQFEPETYEE